MFNTKCRLNQRLKVGKFIRFGLILCITLITLLGASCGLIPGGKECDATVKRFMEAAAAKDIDTVCSVVEEGETNRKELEDLMNNQLLFEGYQDVKMRSINVQMGKLHNAAEYEGEVIYAGDLKGWVFANLVKLGEEWKISGIKVEVSQEKVADYERRHGQ